MFPACVLVDGPVAIVAELTALAALLTATDDTFTRWASFIGVRLPLFYLVLGLALRARDKHADFTWGAAFEEHQEHARRLSEGRDRRREERLRSREFKQTVLKELPKPPGPVRLWITTRPALASFVYVGVPCLLAVGPLIWHPIGPGIAIAILPAALILSGLALSRSQVMVPFRKAVMIAGQRYQATQGTPGSPQEGDESD
jgi:hypothetical protein